MSQKTKKNSYGKSESEKIKEDSSDIIESSEGEEPTEENVVPIDPEPLTYKAKVINCRFLNVREEADKSSNVKCVITSGDIVTVQSYNGEWAHIYTAYGIEGYVLMDFIKED